MDKPASRPRSKRFRSVSTAKDLVEGQPQVLKPWLTDSLRAPRRLTRFNCGNGSVRLRLKSLDFSLSDPPPNASALFRTLAARRETAVDMIALELLARESAQVTREGAHAQLWTSSGELSRKSEQQSRQ